MTRLRSPRAPRRGRSLSSPLRPPNGRGQAEYALLSQASGVAVTALVACALIGCSSSRSTGASPSMPTRTIWSASACRQQTKSIVDDGEQIVLRYRLGSTEPPDVAYLALQSTLSEFQRHGCPPQILGRTLTHRLAHRQRTNLLSHLPSSMVPYLRLTLSCWRAHERRPRPRARKGAASRCSGSLPSVLAISVGKPTSKRWPFTP